MRTGDIGLFKLISESAISSGVRRVEAVTGLNALNWVHHRDVMLRAAAERLNVSPEQAVERLDKVLEERRRLVAELANAQTAIQVAKASTALDSARQLGDSRIAHVELDGVSGKELRSIGENLRGKLGSGAVLVAARDGEKVSLLVAVTADCTSRLHGGKLVSALAPLVGGRGGGRPDMAQAGGSDPSGISSAVETFYAQATDALG